MRIWKLRSLDAENASHQLEQILHAVEYNKPYRCNLNFIFYCIATFRCSTWIWKRRWTNSSVCTPQPINISYIENCCHWLCAYYSPECIHQPKNYSIVHCNKGWKGELNSSQGYSNYLCSNTFTYIPLVYYAASTTNCYTTPSWSHHTLKGFPLHLGNKQL